MRGLEHLERARAAGRGAHPLSGHFGNFELMARAARAAIHPVDFVVQPLSNPGVERWIDARRAGARGSGLIRASPGCASVFGALRQANRWVAMLADQDARRHGVFVPFFGRPRAPRSGPARIALATGRRS